MYQIFANLPSNINKIISSLLSQQKTTKWLTRAEILHNRYTDHDKGINGSYLNDFLDILAYFGLRIPATYAQIYGTFSQIQEIIPLWEPKSLLDIGSGPGTGIWAAKEIWSSLEDATCIDREEYFLSIGKKIIQESSISIKAFFKQGNITEIKNNGTQYDLVLIANTLNELDISQRKHILEEAYDLCKGVMVIIEPGTPFGIKIIQEAVKDFSDKSTLLAPYVNNTFVENNEQWIHFSQRFIRPEFQRRIRQHMRTSALMASDWEETKYAYVAIGKIPNKENFWGRVIGPIKKQKGFLEISVLTKDKIIQVKVSKSYKKEYLFAKKLHWGQIIKDSKNIINSPLMSESCKI